MRKIHGFHPVGALAALFDASFTGGNITPAMRGKRLVSVLPRANQSAERLAAAQAKRERKNVKRVVDTIRCGTNNECGSAPNFRQR